jgi:hypothetical protein
LDLPVFEAFSGGAHEKVAVQGILASGGSQARERLRTLAREQPSEAVIDALAQQPRFEEEALFIDALQQGHRSAIHALGTLGTPTAWSALEARAATMRDDHMLAQAHLYDWSDEGLDRLRAWLAASDRLADIIELVPRDHPLREQLLLQAAHAPAALRSALHALGDDDLVASYVLLAVALESADDDVRRQAAERVAKEPHLFPFIDEVTSPADPLRAIGYHAVLASRRFAHPPSRDWLWEQLADPLVQWPAAMALLRIEDDDTQQELAQWMMAEGPPAAGRAADFHLQRRDQQMDSKPTLPPMRAPVLSRRRVPTADAEALRDDARHVLDTQDRSRRAWALAVLPWVGDDEDVDRFGWRHRSQLADLGTPGALAQLAELGASPATWGWTRTPEGWRRMLDGATRERDFAGVVRPEAVMASHTWGELSIEATSRRLGQRISTERVDVNQMGISECRAALARGSWPRVRATPPPPPAEPVRVPPRPRRADDPIILNRSIAWLTVTEDDTLWVAGDEGLFRAHGAELERRNYAGTQFLAFGRLHIIGNGGGLTFVAPDGQLVDVPVVATRMQVLDEDRVAIEVSGDEVRVYDAYGQRLAGPAPGLTPPNGRSHVVRPRLEASPDGRWAFDGQDVIEVASGRVAASMPGWVRGAAWRPDSAQLAVTVHEQGTWLVDPAQSHIWPTTIPGDRALAWSRDGSTLWTTYGFGVDAYDARTGVPKSTAAAHRVMARVLYVSTDGRTVVSGDYSFGQNILWRRDEEPVALERIDMPPVEDEWLDHSQDPRVPHSAAASDDGATVAVLYNDGSLVVFEGSNGEVRWRGQADAAALDGAQHPDVEPGRRFVMDHMGPERLVGHVVLTPSGRAVIALGIGPQGSDLVQVWRADGHRLVQVRFDAPPLAVGFDRDERWILRVGKALFALSGRTGRLERLADEVDWVWLEDGRPRWGRRGVDLPPPKAPFRLPLLTATLEGGQVVFTERP